MASQTSQRSFLLRWLLSPDPGTAPPPAGDDAQRIDWVRALPFLGIHLACLGVLWVGWSWTALATAAILYAVRMFAVTAFYHRYFAHRAFATSRACQFAFALLGSSALQRGPIWWAAQHRHHHQHSDGDADPHSPRRRGFWWSHLGWFLTPHAAYTDPRRVPDLLRYPELRFLDRCDLLAPALLGVVLYALGAALEWCVPELGTNGLQLLLWGLFVSTVLVYHMTYSINSIAHTFGSRRFATRDDSRNNFLLALVTFGEGWHNNHHHYPAAARQGFYWWEIDLTYYGLVLLSWTGLIWDLRPVPSKVLKGVRA